MASDFYGIQFAIMNRAFRLPGIRGLANGWRGREQAIDSKLAPVFIVGCGHSGTSILTAILDAHPKLAAVPGESFAFRPWWSRDTIADYFNGKLEHLDLANARPVEKTPRHVHEIPRIARLFPRAKFIGIARDGRDVIASLKKRTGKLGAAMDRYIEDNRALLAAEHDSRLHLIRYEPLVKEPELVLRGVLEFLGEPYLPLHQTYQQEQRDWYGAGEGSDHSKLRHAQISKGLFDGSGAWRDRLSDAEVARYTKRCGDIHRQLGYGF